jgi:L-fuculose-phosphate aldolase
VTDERHIRYKVAAAARHLYSAGMNPGRSGNPSARLERGFVITPSGAPYDTMHPDDLVFLDDEGEFGGGQGKPSSEWRLHLEIYTQRREIGAVVHTHSPFATTLACLHRAIPAFHYEIAFAGGSDIRCAPYATFGTPALSDRAVEALIERRACLLANHGAVAIGADLEAAVELAEKVEALARLYWQALQVGEPALLDEAEMARVLAKFSTYGKAG